MRDRCDVSEAARPFVRERCATRRGRGRLLVPATLAIAIACWSGAAGAAPPPLQVTSISPAVADRGELVTISGGGFGAGNLRVTVGGTRVALVSATGNRVSFRVPPLGRVGVVEVVARNPGGREGRIRLEVRFDGVTSAVADDEAAVTSSIGPGGGTIEVEGVRLVIPAGAVSEGTTITATPLRALRGSPFEAEPVGLKLEPSGLVLLRPATLTLPRPGGGGSVVAFGFDGDGEGLHLVPHRSGGATVELLVWHFSGAGTLTADVAELAAVLGYEPTPAHELAEQRIAAALVQAAATGSDPGAAIAAALEDWRRHSVAQALDIARRTARLDFFELAFGEWQAWLAYLQEYRDSLTPEAGTGFDLVSAVDRDVATEAAGAVGRVVLDRCVGPDVPRAALRDVLRLSGAVNLAALPIELVGDPGERPLPDGHNLATACLDVEIVATEHAAVMARDRGNRFLARARVVFWNGEPSTTVSLRYALDDSTDGPPISIASGSSGDGSFEATVRPGAVGTRHFNLTVDLDATGNDSVLRTFFDQRSFSVPVRERLELQARRATDAAFTDTIGTVPAGGTVFLRIRLAGDGLGALPITLTHDAGGVLSTLLTTTDPSGVATLTYTAPAVQTTELVTATVDDAGVPVGDAVVITTRDPVLVTVLPSFGFVSAGQTLQFSATVSGAANAAVTWSAAGGTIDGDGLYHAGSTGGVFAVTATSVAEPGASGTSFVQITSANVAGLYAGTRCFESVSRAGCEPVTVSYVCIGTVCGWFSDRVPPVPATAPFCQVETTGTQTGGPFTGRITFCRFSPAGNFSSLEISGSIGEGRMVFQVRIPDFPFEGATHVETYDLLKVP